MTSSLPQWSAWGQQGSSRNDYSMEAGVLSIDALSRTDGYYAGRLEERRNEDASLFSQEGWWCSGVGIEDHKEVYSISVSALISKSPPSRLALLSPYFPPASARFHLPSSTHATRTISSPPSPQPDELPHPPLEPHPQQKHPAVARLDPRVGLWSFCAHQWTTGPWRLWGRW